MKRLGMIATLTLSVAAGGVQAADSGVSVVGGGPLPSNIRMVGTNMPSNIQMPMAPQTQNPPPMPHPAQGYPQQTTTPSGYDGGYSQNVTAPAPQGNVPDDTQDVTVEDSQGDKIHVPAPRPNGLGSAYK